jgi:hypothetical protein
MNKFHSLTSDELLDFIKVAHNVDEFSYVNLGAWAYKGFVNNKHQYQIIFNADDSKKDEFYVMSSTIGFDFEGNLSFQLVKIVADNLTEDQAIRFILD